MPNVTAPVTVLFRVDVSTTAGMGHLMRCCALAEALGGLTTIQCMFEPQAVELASLLLPNFDVRVRQVPGEFYADVVVTDFAHPDNHRMERNRDYGKVVVSILDTPCEVNDVDIILVPNLLPEWQMACSRSGVVTIKEVLLSSEYSVVKQRAITAAVDRVLICFGGSDPSRLSMRVENIVRSVARDVEYRLCIGPLFPDAEGLRSKLTGREDIALVENKAPMIDEVIMCDIALISGGTLTYEVCSAGRPAVVIAQNADQAVEAGVLHELGAVRFLGLHDEVTDKAIGSAVSEMIDDFAERQAMSAIAGRAIRPGGASRAAQTILECVRFGLKYPEAGRNQNEACME